MTAFSPLSVRELRKTPQHLGNPRALRGVRALWQRARLVPATAPAGPVSFPSAGLDLELVSLDARLPRSVARVAKLAVLLVALTLLSSTSNGEAQLAGTWTFQGKSIQTLTFNGDGTAQWQIDSPRLKGDYALTFQVDYGTLPVKVSLHGFEDGPLAGMSLLGIAEFDGKGGVVFDWTPAQPDQEQRRPESIGPGAQHFLR